MSSDTSPDVPGSITPDSTDSTGSAVSDSGIACTSIGGPHEHVDGAALDAFVGERLRDLDVDGKNVVLVVPDGTRSCPLPMLVGVMHRHLHGRVGSLTAVIALGTHSYMEPDEIDRMFGVGGTNADGTSQPATLEEAYPGLRVVNHEWRDPDMLVEVGHIAGERIAELSEGRLDVGADIVINRHVVESDIAIVVGPVFPHEVVGISGGNKYFIPGVAGPAFIDMTHWVGALITSSEIIGTTGITPVRAMIDEGARLIPTQRLALCCVVESGTGELEAAAFGVPEDAWATAAAVAAQTHVTYVDKPFQRVVAVMPERYDDIWTAAKGFYKTEPAVADGGEVIIYAPHITEVSETHDEIYDIGYHCRDYFVKQWEKFKHIHWGVLAHSTHMRGLGTYDAETGEEDLRIDVTLATAIPRETCEKINVGYLDPATVDLDALEADPDVTVVRNAGEVLFRLRD
ncbi:lactate racemase domain-containing protein [Mobilicoccus massiliensis]|uniref:lactate racemase domain-containing protein n=1 Tax=Mobilicoccus massiliensis TaxID=1522310 RepID=UPI000B0D2135|nr:lactate racemase domain-containing protein [Mobilicoccus massiliensis]